MTRPVDLVRTSVLVAAACVLTGCAAPVRQHPLIDRYTGAACLPLLKESRVQPPVREWEVTLRPSGGGEVTLMGAQTVSGAIVARDSRTGVTHVVAAAGDYVYPADVRTTTDFGRVYVKAKGLAGGIWHETWLFEYDLVQHRQLAKARVDPRVLPPECPGGPASAQATGGAAQQ